MLLDLLDLVPRKATRPTRWHFLRMVKIEQEFRVSLVVTQKEKRVVVLLVGWRFLRTVTTELEFLV